MTKSIAAQSKQPYSQEQIELIKNTVAKGATNDELKLFFVIAARTGLDVFTKQIHFVKRGGQGTIQTGIDGYRAIAERTKTLAGIDDAEYDSEDQAHPKKASVTVYRLIEGQKVSFSASARWDEYVPQAGQDFMWKKMPYLMLGKVAEALALRKAFPNDLSGLYTHEEMEQAGSEGIPQSTPSVSTDVQKEICNVHGTEGIHGRYGLYCPTKVEGRFCKGPFKRTEPQPIVEVEPTGYDKAKAVAERYRQPDDLPVI
jgi:phage recombination protein Bet